MIKNLHSKISYTCYRVISERNGYVVIEDSDRPNNRLNYTLWYYNYQNDSFVCDSTSNNLTIILDTYLDKLVRPMIATAG